MEECRQGAGSSPVFPCFSPFKALLGSKVDYIVFRDLPHKNLRLSG